MSYDRRLYTLVMADRDGQLLGALSSATLPRYLLRHPTEQMVMGGDDKSELLSELDGSLFSRIGSSVWLEHDRSALYVLEPA